jgi:hypothetical protein
MNCCFLQYEKTENLILIWKIVDDHLGPGRDCKVDHSTNYLVSSTFFLTVLMFIRFSSLIFICKVSCVGREANPTYSI